MSKVVVYILDRIVWMLFITALTTQALQIAGVLETPKGLAEISYSKEHEYNIQLSAGDSDTIRGKRETPERSKFIDGIFNIPIQALTAVNNLIQNSRPALKTFRDFAIRRFMKSRSTTEAPLSNLHRRSYPVYVRPKDETETQQS